MKFIEPRFEIISKDFTRQNVLSRIEDAARTCYKSEDKKCEGSDVRLLKNLLKRDHTAMIEHAPNLSVRFICDRGVSHELVRHRLASFAQESTRYVNYGNKDMEFIIPCWIQGADRDTMLSGKTTCDINDNLTNIWHDRNKVYIKACLKAAQSYKYLIEKGWTPQEARSVLPNSIKTEIVVTANVREWRTIFKLRCDKAAHPQMRELMCPLLTKLEDEIPELWGDVCNDIWGTDSPNSN